METSVILPIGDGDYECALFLPQLAELQEKCGYTDRAGNRRRKGILAIHGSLLAGRYDDPSAEDGVLSIAEHGQAEDTEIYEVIRLGLIGGGRGMVNGVSVKVGALEARALMDRYVHALPIEAAWKLAAHIIFAKVKGVEPSKKAQPEEGPAVEEATE